ncbi:MAG: flavodoxin domain-containing protein [Candidatus Bathyarchaeota archaeon]|nr:flavodoxin domain-containing protein [Candidatus Bathyarchaeota archaeon]MDH5494751.1 flavodoxin domain-containing protein [Candidatus Bathyarchaeota archaeon]
MKVLVAYYSETGNTEKVARAISEEASKDHEAYLEKIEDVTADALNNYDLVFLGSACHSTDLAAPVKRILNAIPHSPKFKLAGFFTHATSSGGFNRWASKCILSFQETSKEKRIDFKGYYNCQGAPSPPIQEFIKREIITSAAEWEGYFEEVMNHPTTEDLHKAREFARDILSQLD